MSARLGLTTWMLFLLAETFCLVGVSSAEVYAADVQIGVSTREAFVGLPLILRIQINNVAKPEVPVMPEVDGLTIESAGAPSRSSRISIVNGRRSERSTVTFSYRVTPQREGTFTIPPIKVVTDASYMITKAVRIVASKSETNDLMFVEVEGNEKELFVGEALHLTLKIWIRPYSDKQLQISLDEETIWRLISDQTTWGAFSESLENMAQNHKRPGGNQVLRNDSNGLEREYWLYEIEATVYPDRPGRIDANDVRVIVNYPLELGRSRSPFSMFDDDSFGSRGIFDDSFFRGFGSTLGITKARPIVAEASVEPIVVKPIPENGRPDDYRGAVGQYSIISEAMPTKVKVGDPITLHLAIDGTGPMDRLRAPPLASQKNLIENFKVPDEPLAGFVDQSRKVFSTTIRPLHDGVTEIPPISLSYFDPETEAFVTTHSHPISIQVEKADLLALDRIVGGNRASIDATTSEGPIFNSPTTELTLFSGPLLLENMMPASVVSSRMIAMILFPPILAFALLAFASRHLVSGLVSSRRQFRRFLTSAQSPVDVAAALECFLARRFRLPESRLSRDQAVGRLRASGEHDLAIRTERLYANCEKATRSPISGESLESLKNEAMRIVDEVAGNKSAMRYGKQPRKLSSTSTSAIGVLIVLSLAQSPVADAGGGEIALSRDQQRVLLDEAVSIYSSAAAESNAADRQDRQDHFAKSAEKLQLLVDSGLHNDRLFFNLASARINAGQTGHAIANYRRALRLAPTNQLYWEGLAMAQQGTIRSPGSFNTLATAVSAIRAANDTLLRFVSPVVISGISWFAWVAFWGVIALRAVRIEFRWKTAASLALLCAALTASSYFLRVSEFTQNDTAVLVAANVSIREGDGTEFAETSAMSSAEGHVVKVLARRGDWIRISTDSGLSGWIRRDASEEI